LNSSHFFVNRDKDRFWQVLNQVITLLNKREREREREKVSDIACRRELRAPGIIQALRERKGIQKDSPR
jgi:hypothetical protein